MKSPYLSRNLKVVDALDDEIDYVNSLPRRTEPYTVAGQLTTLQALINQAHAAYYNNAGSEPTLDVFRKIAAVAVIGLIQHGCPRRPERVQPLRIYDEDRLSDFKAKQEEREKQGDSGIPGWMD